MIFLYILFPFLGIFSGIKNFFYSNKRTGLLVFAFFFGYSVYYFSGDILHYRDDFAKFEHVQFEDYLTDITSLNSNPSKDLGVYNIKPDIYAYTLGFLVSRVTSEPRWFFALVSLIYFFAFFKFYKEIKNYVGFLNTFGFKLFSLGIVMIVPFYVGVTGVRFWTALFVFLYFIMRYLNTKQIKFILFSALSILFHYTFFFPLLIVLISYFIRLNKNLIKALVIIALLFAFLSSTTNSLQIITNSISYFNLAQVEEAGSSYLDADNLKARAEGISKTNWYVKARGDLINIFFFGFFIFDFFKLSKWRVSIQDRFFNNLYILFFLISAFTINLGSISRFIYIFYFLVLIRILMIQYSSQKSSLKNLNRIFIPILTLHIFVTFRAGFYFVDPLVLISPSAVLLFLQSDISLSELLIGH